MSSLSLFMLVLTLQSLSWVHGIAISNAKSQIHFYPRRFQSSISLPASTERAPSLPQYQLRNDVNIETPTFTGGRYIASANQLSFPNDIASTVLKARTEKRSMDVFAVHLRFSTFGTFTGIPKLRIFAHTCSLSGSVYFSNSGPPTSSSSTSTAPTGVTPQRAPSGNDGGEIEIFCRHIVVAPGRTMYFTLNGSSGRPGAKGGSGRNGLTGTPGSRGRCKSRKIIFRIGCKTTRGHAGISSTNGSDGAQGGPGGNGGDGGKLKLVYDEAGSSQFTVRTSVSKGKGGAGGSGGAPGRNGDFIPNIQYVTSCRSKCRERLATENRPVLTTRRSGPSGAPGSDGKEGTYLINKSFATTLGSFDQNDFLRFAGLAERYANDLVLSNGSCKEASEVMDTIVKLASQQPRISLLQTMGRSAELNKKAIQLHKSFFGPASLSRTAPVPIDTELSRDLAYVEALKDQMELSKLQSNLLGAIVASAGISIPATNFQALKQNLQTQRDIFHRAVIDTEARIEQAYDVILFEFEDHILAKKDEADRARQKAKFKAVLSVVNIAVAVVSLDIKNIFSSTSAVIGAIKDVKFTFDDLRTTFKRIGNATEGFKELLSTATKIKDNLEVVKEGFSKAESAGCNFEELRKLLVASPDRIDKFPNLVAFDADFSKILDIGVVTELSAALLKVRASSFTSQFSCILQEKLDDVPKLKAAVDNYFILAGSRIEILGRMVDIDIEIQEVLVKERGVQTQKDHLKNLQADIQRTTPSSALTALSVTFEYGRLRALQTIERLSTSYSNLVLKDLSYVVQSYAKNRLKQNGLLGFQGGAQYANLVKLEADLKRVFRSAQQCATAREIPSVAYYSFDITPENSPDLFEGKLRTGPASRSSIVLDIHSNCAFYAGNGPPTPMLANRDTRPACVPNLHTFNARMTKISAELIGGDESLLPPGRSSISASLDQVGLQTFHAKPGTFKSFDMTPLQFGLGFISLRKGASSVITYHSTCFVGTGALGAVDVDSPRVCPSPFSAYALQIGLVEEPGLHAYLDSVKAIRVHTHLIAFTRSTTAQLCF